MNDYINRKVECLCLCLPVACASACEQYNTFLLHTDL